MELRKLEKAPKTVEVDEPALVPACMEETGTLEEEEEEEVIGAVGEKGAGDGGERGGESETLIVVSSISRERRFRRRVLKNR